MRYARPRDIHHLGDASRCGRRRPHPPVIRTCGNRAPGAADGRPHHRLPLRAGAPRDVLQPLEGSPRGPAANPRRVEGVRRRSVASPVAVSTTTTSPPYLAKRPRAGRAPSKRPHNMDTKFAGLLPGTLDLLILKAISLVVCHGNEFTVDPRSIRVFWAGITRANTVRPQAGNCNIISRTYH